MNISLENTRHHSDVRQLHVEAFPSSVESELVEQLRKDDDGVISLVALEEDNVVGHVMFSRMNAPFKALGLAPISVSPHWQRLGIAAQLIEEGVKQAKAGGWEGIFVLGDPAYYERFGFSVGAAEKFKSPYAGPYLMLLILNEDSIIPWSGRIEYAPAFSALG
jgi:putative acetyltransferase